MTGMLARMGSHFLVEVLLRTLRGSLLIGGAVAAVSATGPWQYMSSSFTAHDMRRAAAWSAVPRTDIVMVTIGDESFERDFGGASPLPPQRLAPLLTAVADGAPQAQAWVVDLDMAPAQDEPPVRWQALVQALSSPAPDRWVVANPQVPAGGATAARVRWREALCTAGVRLAHPYLPSEFGYPVMTHQYHDGLADVAAGAPDACARSRAGADEAGPEANALLARRPAPMSASFLLHGVEIPFQGDLPGLTATLQMLAPRFVVVGGTWGQADVFLTPFGERHGVHLHAAALAGQEERLSLAPQWLRLVLAWATVALMTVAFGAMQRRVKAAAGPWVHTHPGHGFLMARLWPLWLAACTVAMVLAVAEADAVLLAGTGLWIPSAATATVVAASLVMSWNWGLNEFRPHAGFSSAWHEHIVVPIRADLTSLAACARRLRHGPAPAQAAGSAAAMSRSRALAEAVLALASLVAQTLLPLTSVAYALSKPL